MQQAQYALHARVEDRHWWFTGRRRIARALVERLCPPGAGHSVLDIGCGTGANLAALADGWRCRGIDASEQAVGLARQRFPALEFACEVDPLARADWIGAADVVLLMDVLEHVEDDFLLLSRVLSALRADAQVLITVPADPRLWSRHDESFGHFRRYETERLRATWSGLAVSERLLCAFNARLLPLIRAVRGVNRRLGRTAGRAGTDFHLPLAPLNRWLERLFAGEARTLLGALEGREGYRAGASLIALLRRESGPIAPRTRPEGLAPDLRGPIRAG